MRRGALAPTGGGQLGRRSNGRQQPGCGARVCTVVGAARSLTGGARLVAGGHGGERRGAHVRRSRKEMEWAEPIENVKWVVPR
jgi:hypothetical protein